ncbi:MAG: hypothetical protein E7318_06860 [Clostridiales bacterium]|nr:hypothetical protein [Clostridiales bacterium]
MNATTIVYTSNTGFTARYAAMLSEKLGLPAYTLSDALTKLPTGTPVIYMGWLMAGSVAGCKKASKRFAIEAVIGVGLGDTGAQDDAARKACKLPTDVPVFTVQGGMDHAKLKGGYKVGIRLLTKVMAAKKNRTPGEDKMLDLLIKGGDYVSEKELSAVLAWADK